MIYENNRRLQLLLCTVATSFLVLVTACAPRTTNINEASKPIVVDPTVIQDRALESFAKAIFYKPNEPRGFDFDITLAPLIVQEATGPLDVVPHIGPYPIPKHKKAQLTPQPPSVIVQKRNGRGATRDKEGNMIERDYVIRDFVWRYPSSRKHGKDVIPEARGVRVISNKEETPLVWQVLDNRDGPTVLYVSTELEKAAAEQFGPPLSGRKFSIEKGLDEKPNVVVARVIEAGPVPMGPYVYLSAEDQSVTSIVCRCMSSQINEFVETRYYELSDSLPIVLGNLFKKGGIDPKLNPEWGFPLLSAPVVQAELRWPILPEDTPTNTVQP